MDKILVKVVSAGILLVGVMFALAPNTGEASSNVIEKIMSPVNKTATDNGISLNIQNALKDGHDKVTLYYNIYTNKVTENQGVMDRPDISINGKRINARFTNHIESIGKGEYEGMLEIYPEKKLPNHLDVKFNVDSVLSQSGQWTVDFSI